MTTKLGDLSHCIFFLLFITFLSNGLSSGHQALSNESAAMKPVAVLGTLVLNETRRRLRSFKICALCTCCGGPKGICLPSPCCYAINCHIPN
ncbi:hypothetical protein COCNU_11G002790 [Cocos nucifera]|uniref:DUF7866 domain-containing protein n=1 Tax=Cocos nucifera TaxID=13894 RepID=A0A8K0IMZ5_COCNU|nr:hypothetical protein COCNU_11G002790 [Cocos nucifera]